MPGTPREGGDRLLGIAPAAPAAVVEGGPAAVRADQVDGPPGAGRGVRSGERDAVLAVEGAHQLALGVVAHHVEVVDPQAEAAQAQRHEVAGVPGPRQHPLHQPAVRVRQGQFGHVDDGVHARAAEDQYVEVVLGSLHPPILA